MGRILRAYSESGVYHILFRGVNQQNIFEEKADYDKLKDALLVIKEEMEFETCQKCTSPNGSSPNGLHICHVYLSLLYTLCNKNELTAVKTNN